MFAFIMVIWVILTFFVYNLFFLFDFKNITLHFIDFLSCYISVLNKIKESSNNPLPRQVAQIMILLWSLLMFISLSCSILFNNVMFFCSIIKSKRKNIIKSFFMSLTCFAGFFELFLSVTLTDTSYGYRSAALNAFFSDSNSAIIITYLFNLLGVVISCIGFFIPLCVFYIFNDKYRMSIFRRISDD